MTSRFRIGLAALAVGTALAPCIAFAQIADPKPGQGAPSATPRPVAPQEQDPEGDAPIVPDAEFEKAVPELSDDMAAPLEPMEAFGVLNPPAVQANDPQAQPAPAEADTELAAPLVPLPQFDVTPVQIAGVEDEGGPEIRYTTRVEGLDKIELQGRFNALSALKDDGDAPNAAVLAARAKEDEGLAVRLMQSMGYYDGTASSTIEQPKQPGGRATAVLRAVPGRRYSLATITVIADPTVPPNLIETSLPLKAGDPIEAERIQGAEANVSLKLPQTGYPFAEVGQRDILLDEAVGTGDYTLPVVIGPRGSFGAIRTEGTLAFGADHIEVLRRYEPGQLYDSRKVDDLRDALVATNLFSTVSVEPQRTGRTLPDGTEAIDLLVQQQAGPARSLAATAGYGTGQGIRVEGSWTHRNLFPPEGALIVDGVAGTLEQGLGVTFRRSNAGQRDRIFTITARANRSNYEAFEGFTGTLAARIARESTPIWQKRFTYAFGVELVGTNEDRFNFATNRRERNTYFIGAIPAQAQWDTSDDLLNPMRGWRLKASVSPEVSIRGGTRPYARLLLEGSAYFPIADNIVIAGRLRGGSIPGIDRDDLAPSRRYYAGGGGSVRGFGFQQLGPRSTELDSDGNTVFRPVGGRSVNEAAVELRYRFGNFGIVPFVDIGQVYDSVLPTGRDLRMGAGIGGRFYTNFGPFRVDVATPINRREGESKVAVYLSIGQAF